MRRHLLHIVLLLGMILFFGCKKEEGQEFPTELNIQVVVDRGGIMEKVTNARVAVYTDLAIYQTSQANAGGPLNSGAIGGQVRESIEGVLPTYTSADIGDISGITLYVDAYFFDGEEVYRNINTQFEIQPMEEGSITTVRIVLKVVNKGFVYFWSSDDKTSPNNPVLIRVDNITGVLESTRTTSPSIFDINSTRRFDLETREAEYTYRAITNEGCVFIGTFKVIEGESVFVELGECRTGKVIFYTPSGNSDGIDLEVDLGSTITTGQLNANFTSTVPSECPGTPLANTLEMNLPVGTHIYSGNSGDGNCFWSDSFQIIDNQCTFVRLEDCN